MCGSRLVGAAAQRAEGCFSTSCLATSVHSCPSSLSSGVHGLPLLQGCPEGGPLLHLARHLGGAGGERHAHGLQGGRRLLAGPRPIHLGECGQQLVFRFEHSQASAASGHSSRCQLQTAQTSAPAHCAHRVASSMYSIHLVPPGRPRCRDSHTVLSTVASRCGAAFMLLPIAPHHCSHPQVTLLCGKREHLAHVAEPSRSVLLLQAPCVCLQPFV